jgi:hypothetical protein
MYNTDLPSRAELPSTRQLLRSTAIAVVIAATLLITVVLPAEYGIDPTGIGQRLNLTAMGKIKASLAAEAAADKKSALTTMPQQASAAAPQISELATSEKAPETIAATKSDEMKVTLKPGEATEVKLRMVKGAKVTYSWRTDGGLVNHDTHGDPLNGPKDAYYGYSKAKQVSGDTGELTAAFDGNHGWFWRNRSDNDVTITLKTTGTYQSIKKMM